MDEFDLINRFFAPLGARRDDIVCGIGDDGAIIVPRANQNLVVAVDTLVAGRHFPVEMSAEAIGYRSVAVNLSDLAAMAATPYFATLALTLPAADATWLAAFARGFGRALGAVDCALIGGDTTRGPLTITVQVIGSLDGPALTRDSARPGDLVMVSGTLGDARAALDVMPAVAGDAVAAYLVERFEQPTARLTLARAVREFVHAAIDVSDGLVADLGHIAAASGVAIELELDSLPLSGPLLELCGRPRALDYAASGGDDYELAMTVHPAERERVLALAAACGETLTVVGRVLRGSGVACFAPDGDEVQLGSPGFRHFE